MSLKNIILNTNLLDLYETLWRLISVYLDAPSSFKWAYTHLADRKGHIFLHPVMVGILMILCARETSRLL